jgi:HTH-type transcriptional regulator/antitoxin HipB
MDIGARIKSLRAELGWSQVELGRRAAIHPITITKIETGTHRPTLGTLEALASAFGVEVSDLMRDAA